MQRTNGLRQRSISRFFFYYDLENVEVNKYLGDFSRYDDPESRNTPDKIRDEYLVEHMIATLSNFDITKVEWVTQNCRILDYVKLKCLKKYDNYCERISSKSNK